MIVRIIRLGLLSVYILGWLALASSARPVWMVDLESGAVFSGYNDVRIPGAGGTLFSLSGDLQVAAQPFFRGRFTCLFQDRHWLSLLVAPLRLHAEGTTNFPIGFQGVTFPAGTPLEGLFRFDSFRLTYRYDFWRRVNLRLGLGFTAKIRDAEIRLAGGGLRSQKTNTGFVPILNFNVDWRWSPLFHFNLNGDALAAPQGRAEDVQVALLYQVQPWIKVKAGYRLLEGGADNDEVYNFALIHYLVAGVVVSL